MAFSETTKLKLPQWSSGGDSPTRLQLNAAFANLEDRIHGVYTTAERDAMDPLLRYVGRVIVNSTTARLEYWDGSAWQPVGTVADGTITIAKLAFDPATQAELDALAEAALLKTGGTMTGALNLADQELLRPLLRDYAETTNIVAASGAARTLDYAVANVHDITLDQNCTFTFSNPPATGRTGSLTVILRQPATLRAVTWPASVKWPSATAPTMAINTVNAFTFITRDAGVTWLGVGSVLDVR